MITSFRQGRVRVRADGLCCRKTLDEVKAMLGNHPGIETITGNSRTGSLLITYDPAVISDDQLSMAADALRQHLADAEASAPEKRKGYRTLSPRQMENRVLLGAFTLCLAGIFGARSMHIAGGVLFAGAAFKHLFDRRNTL